MTISPERLEGAQNVVIDVLSEQVTLDSDPMLFEEDIVLFSVRIVEQADPVWLLAQLADVQYPFAGRVEVLSNMRDRLDEALAILRREDPTLNYPGIHYFP